MRAFPQTIAAERPRVTASELAKASRRSTGIVRSMAGGSLWRFQAIYSHLRTPVGEKFDDDSNYDTRPVDPQRLIYAADGQKVTAVGNDQPPFTIPRTDEPPVLLHGYLDLDAIPDGCPARIMVIPGKPPPLLRSYAQSVTLAELHWKLTVPSTPPIDLGTLEPPIDDLAEIRELALSGIDADVRVLPSATGRLSIEYTGETPLNISATAAGLSISGGPPQGPLEARQGGRPQVVIRTPQRLHVKVENVPNLDLDYVSTIDVDLPENGQLLTAPDPKSRVNARPASRVLFVAEYPEPGGCPDQERSWCYTEILPSIRELPLPGRRTRTARVTSACGI